MGRSGFFLTCIQKRAVFQPVDCPYCGSLATRRVQRKKLVLQLRRCDACSLMFRYPKDNETENKGFYQTSYMQETVTSLPAKEDLPDHIASRFAKVGRDLTEHLSVIQSIVPRGRLLDYGCSWGYCVYQFREHGYDAAGFEISRPRVDYGREMLGLDLVSDLAELPDASFDVIYSAHVLEHIPNPAASFVQFKRLLKPGGMLFLFVPNCAGEPARRLGVGWGPMINEKHVLALTAEFFHRNLSTYGFSTKFGSSPYESPPLPYEEHMLLDGEELLMVGKCN
jgi:2-polyprenyl-3-methyl-5-hydroxy-6-metoxy-1,4-benzoquinol methylase